MVNSAISECPLLFRCCPGCGMVAKRTFKSIDHHFTLEQLSFFIGMPVVMGQNPQPPIKWAVAFVRFHDVFLKVKATSLVYLQQNVDFCRLQLTKRGLRFGNP